MSKYPSSTPMRSVILQETGMIDRILRKSGLNKQDREDVLTAYKEAAYQWCSSNAMACAMEQAVIEIYGDEGMQAVNRTVRRNGVIEAKMLDTYPFD